jgi:hypothetical protein
VAHQKLVVSSIIANSLANIGLVSSDPLVSSVYTSTIGVYLPNNVMENVKGFVCRHMGDACYIMNMLTGDKQFQHVYNESTELDIHPSKGVRIAYEPKGIANVIIDLSRYTALKEHDTKEPLETTFKDCSVLLKSALDDYPTTSKEWLHQLNNVSSSESHPCVYLPYGISEKNGVQFPTVLQLMGKSFETDNLLVLFQVACVLASMFTRPFVSYQ